MRSKTLPPTRRRTFRRRVRTRSARSSRTSSLRERTSSARSPRRRILAATTPRSSRRRRRASTRATIARAASWTTFTSCRRGRRWPLRSFPEPWRCSSSAIRRSISRGCGRSSKRARGRSGAWCSTSVRWGRERSISKGRSLRSIRLRAAGVPGSATRLTLGASFAHPDSNWPLEGLALVRDDEGRIADVRARAAVARGAREPTCCATSLVRLPACSASRSWPPPGSGGRTLTVTLRFEGRTLVERSVPIAVDPALAVERPSARGGCATSTSRGPGGSALVAMFAALLVLRRRRAA